MSDNCDVGDPIVLCAHSNQAATVLLERVHKLAKEWYGTAYNLDTILIETPGRAQHRKDHGPALPTGLESYTLESQKLMLARRYPKLYGAFAQHHEKRSRGIWLEHSDFKAYQEADQAVTQRLREGRTIFICTVSALNTNFFTKRHVNGGKQFKCAVLVVDEASQCPMPAFLEGWVWMNPRALVIGGDSAQLQCFAYCEKAKMLWRKSPISYAEEMGEEFCVLLDVQYRMPAALYHPTSFVHYGGRIQTPPGGYVFERALSQKIRHIEIDPRGDGKWRKLDQISIIVEDAWPRFWMKRVQ